MSTNPSRASGSVRNSHGRSLLSREEHYKQLNDELSAKTANLVQEAEAVLRGQESILSKPSLLDRISTDEYLDDDFGYEYETERIVRTQESSRNTPDVQHISKSHATLQASSASKSVPVPQGKTRRAIPKSTRSRASGYAAGDDVAVIDEQDDFSLQKTISAIEQKINTAASEDMGSRYEDDDDVMPAVANEMGADAQIRFLKAKLRVMQEEMDRMSVELASKEEKLHDTQTKIKDVDEERNRLLRTNAAQLAQLDKYKKLSEDSKSRADSLDSQLTSLKKELETFKRNQKQQSTNQSATEVRLNQAREDVQKYKNLFQKAQSDAKESLEQEKAKIDHLVTENKRLEKQKSELMSGFKKQLKLIDVLKRQKMHIEAARMLNFTEEEFVKALEWGN